MKTLYGTLLQPRHTTHGSYPSPSPGKARWLLTRGGAEALGISDRIGLIAPGYDADCRVVRPEPSITHLPQEQRISALLYTIQPQHIGHVSIAGRRVGP